MLRIVILLFIKSSIGEQYPPTPTPPLYRISATNLYHAGLQHGQSAKERIHGWFATQEMVEVFAFAAGKGKTVFEQLKHDNSLEFPDLVQEMRGIAEGANVTVDQIWGMNLLPELESHMRNSGYRGFRGSEHCSDVYAISSQGYSGGFAEGHNEDWGTPVKPFWYFISYRAITDAGSSEPAFENCAGMIYPGSVVGWAPTWNSHGMYLTQNTLKPLKTRSNGFSMIFAQRRALSKARNLDDAVAGLKSSWSDGASVNLVDLHGKRMANVEVWENLLSKKDVTEAMGNYTHFNLYKHMKNLEGDYIDGHSQPSTLHRQARLDALPAPRSARDIMDRLSDMGDPELPVFRETTLTTLVLNGTTGQLNVWCCGTSAASAPDKPVYSWNLHSFFDYASDDIAELIV